MRTGVRAAVHADVEALRDVERAAGEPFRALGMDAVADDEPPAADVLGAFVDGDRAWVAERDGVLAGYLVAGVVDGCGHVEQVSVHPDHARRRIGVALVERAAGWASGLGLAALTLTTFRDVPWNGPYYVRIGFRWLADDEVGAGLRAVRDAEIRHGLDRWPRGCMRRDLVAP